jgi:hypothetical protein
VRSSRQVLPTRREANGRIWAAFSLHPDDNTVSNTRIPDRDIAGWGSWNVVS